MLVKLSFTTFYPLDIFASLILHALFAKMTCLSQTPSTINGCFKQPGWATGLITFYCSYLRATAMYFSGLASMVFPLAAAFKPFKLRTVWDDSILNITPQGYC